MEDFISYILIRSRLHVQHMHATAEQACNMVATRRVHKDTNFGLLVDVCKRVCTDSDGLEEMMKFMFH